MPGLPTRPRFGTAPMKIRAFEAPDEPQVIDLWHACDLTRPWNDPRLDIARKARVQPELFLVGVEQAQVIATVMAGYDGHRGWINDLAVAPAHRGKRHAAALLHRVEERLREAGCPRLNLQIRAGNADALAFYRRMGYAQDDVLSFGKRLSPDPSAA